MRSLTFRFVVFLVGSSLALAGVVLALAALRVLESVYWNYPGVKLTMTFVEVSWPFRAIWLGIAGTALAIGCLMAILAISRSRRSGS